MARVFLIDDHPAVRHGLGLVLASQSHTICGEAGSVGETLAWLGSATADIALLDLSLGEESGLDLIAALRQRGVATLVYSMHEDSAAIRAAFAAGAKGYVSKREMADVLLAAVGELLAGGRYVSALAARNLNAPTVKSGAGADLMLATLSEREQQILAMLGRGESNNAIAQVLAISVRTVETYFGRIAAKLSVGGTRELRRYAIKSAGATR
jgi:DNA-binding NarL/FixJ family response regulator